MANDDLDARMAAMFQGNYLDASDLAGTGDVTLVIDSVVPPNEEKDAAGKVINKGVVRFKGARKAMILNKVNAKMIAMIHGKKSSQWVGKTISLTVRYLKAAFGQQNVPVIRVKPSDAMAMTFGMRKHYGQERPYTDDELRAR